MTDSSPDRLGTDDHVFGLACWSGAARPMPRAHRHDDIEVNVVVRGQLDYLFGGRRIVLPAGTTSIFWAALPHQVVATEADSLARWLTVPLAVVLRWRLAEPRITELLSGTPLVAAGTPAELTRSDTEQRFARWSDDLAAPDPALADIALLEMEAYLHRLLRLVGLREETREPDRLATARTRSRAAVMATFVASRFREPLSVDDVAAAVHLNPHYAMQLFRAAVGTTIGGYLTSCRLAEAQRLLITSALTVEAVAHAAGFGSAGRLYAACADAGLPPPAAYRRRQQEAAGWS